VCLTECMIVSVEYVCVSECMCELISVSVSGCMLTWVCQCEFVSEC